MSGARFGYLFGPGALLKFALVRFAMDRLTAAGFVPMVPPVLVRREAMFGTGFLPTDEQQIFRIADDDLYLAGTSEVPLVSYHSDELLDPGTLPLRYAGFSSCFRREAGSYGKDTRGIFRVHQFDKVEMVSFVLPEDSVREHELLLAREEEILQALELPYRVVDIAAGDLGGSAARKFDCEAWIPSQGTWRELTSTSNCTDYQARRIGCRVKEPTATVPRTPSTAPPWPSAAPSSPCSRTTSSPTARSRSRSPCGPTWTPTSSSRAGSAPPLQRPRPVGEDDHPVLAVDPALGDGLDHRPEKSRRARRHQAHQGEADQHDGQGTRVVAEELKEGVGDGVGGREEGDVVLLRRAQLVVGPAPRGRLRLAHRRRTYQTRPSGVVDPLFPHDQQRPSGTPRLSRVVRRARRVRGGVRAPGGPPLGGREALHDGDALARHLVVAEVEQLHPVLPGTAAVAHRELDHGQVVAGP